MILNQSVSTNCDKFETVKEKGSQSNDGFTNALKKNSRMIVLIVDENWIFRKIVEKYTRKFLETENIIKVCDAHEAVEVMEKIHPDIIFCDGDKRSLNENYDTLMIREANRKVTIIGFTECLLKKEKVQKLGLSDIILKPLDPSKFVKTLQRWIV